MADKPPSKLGGSHNNLAKSLAPSRAGSKSNLAHSRIGSLKNLAKASVPTAETEGQPPANAIVYENTYKTKPDRKFPAEPVKRLIDATFTKHLTKVKYDYEVIPELTKKIADDLLAQIKELNYERYKISVHVEIGEFKGQGVKVGSRALWDTTTDTFASGSFRNATLFAVGMVFAAYFE